MPERSVAMVSAAGNLFDEMSRTCSEGGAGQRGLPGEAPRDGSGKSASAAIVALAHARRHAEVVELFCRMRRGGAPVSKFVLPSMLGACAGLQNIRMLRTVHALVIKCALCQHVIVCTALVDGYTDFGLMDDARKVFDEITDTNIVSWSVLIGGYVRSSRWEEALDAFSAMGRAGVIPNDSVLVMAIQACSALGRLVHGKQLHALAVVLGFERNPTVWNCLMDMYGKCGDIDGCRMVFEMMIGRDQGSALVDMYGKCSNMELARMVFDRMDERNYVSWDALLSGRQQDAENVCTMIEERNSYVLDAFSKVFRDDYLI
ncbi:hypothetical protein E2562_010436 [Oryza meyeriana var. granulata]|uniref:Pentatricopeptide repeat-containing protein n=1 Tax=Oryza meyeriana var. granulata TaxID=110450 RepID=A0A6G1F6R3_9ORYZ|nr:hypothetical protein E2562_010436 [Oryza meyeriana var. granulata]